MNIIKSYGNIALAREELRQLDAKIEQPDALIASLLRGVSERIDLNTDYTFVPIKKTVYIDGEGDQIDLYLNTVTLPEPFLSIDGVTVGGTVLTDDDYVISPRGGSDPIRALRMLSASPVRWNSTGSINSWQDSIAVSGMAGYRRGGLTGGWLTSLDVVKLAITTDSPLVQSIKVADINGLNAWGMRPRISAGDFLLIDAEMFYTVSTDTRLNTAQTMRAVNGTIAAVHTLDTPIYVWQPDSVAQRAAIRWVSYLFKRMSHFETTSTDPQTMATVTFPPDMPGEVRNILNELGDKIWGGV